MYTYMSREAARVTAYNYVKFVRNMHCPRYIEISHFVNVAKRADDQCSIFSTVQ